MDKLGELTERVTAAIQAATTEAEGLKQQLEAELDKIGAVGDLAATGLVRQIAELRGAEPTRHTIDKAQELAAKITQERVKHHQREARLDLVRQELETLPPDKQSAAQRFLDDPQSPIETIRVKLEELRSGFPSERPVVKSTEEEIRRKTFSNSPEDLARLAELFRDPVVQIVAVEIHT
jgi:hypothetical protein